ncbi:MAG: hypothetical protein WA655_03590 [Candidatus Korobacteraceae bacterium]
MTFAPCGIDVQKIFPKFCTLRPVALDRMVAPTARFQNIEMYELTVRGYVVTAYDRVTDSIPTISGHLIEPFIVPMQTGERNYTR